MNYYPEPIAPGQPEKNDFAMVRTQGLKGFCMLPQAPNRGLWPGDRRLFGAGGNHLYEVLANATTVDHGYIGNDNNPVQMFPNGEQLFIVSDGLAWIDTGSGAEPVYFSLQLFDLAIDPVTHGLTGPTGGIFDATDVGETVAILSGTGFTVQTQIITSVVGGEAFGANPWGVDGSTGGEGIEWLYSLGQMPAAQGAFLDGYFFASKPEDKIIQFSAINDGTMWNPADNFIKQSYPDNVNAMTADHQELYVFGDLESAEVFEDTGNALTPFQPDPGAIMHFGCVAPYSLCRLSEGLAFLGGDVRRGDRLAFLAVGFRPRQISGPAEEIAWKAYPTISDAIAYSEIYDGHEFWVIHFPSGNATWAYDRVNEKWHQRGSWTGAFDANGFPTFNRQRQSFHAVVALGTPTSNNPEVHYVGDWQTGQIYIQSAAYLDDNGTTIYRMRRAPHLTKENLRTFYSRFELDVDVTGTQRVYWNRFGKGRDRIYNLVTWQPAGQGVSMSLSYSDTRTQTWVTRSTQTLAPSVDVTIANAYLIATPGNT